MSGCCTLLRGDCPRLESDCFWEYGNLDRIPFSKRTSKPNTNDWIEG